MKHRIRIDGDERDIDIRAMDASFVVYRKMYVPPLTPANIGRVGPGDPAGLEEFLKSDRPKIIEEFFRKQIRAIGSCAILAWDQGGVIGKMYFTTKELFASVGPAAKALGLDHDEFPGCMCIENPDMPKVVQSFREEQLQSLLASPSRTLRILCLNVGHFDTRYHGQGIASAMLEFLKGWASERGWRTLEAPSCADVVPFRAVGPQVFRRGYLEKRGFCAVEEKPAQPEDTKRRRRGIKRILSGNLSEGDWDVKSYAWNIEMVRRLANDPSWREVYDKTYIMACDLGTAQQFRVNGAVNHLPNQGIQQVGLWLAVLDLWTGERDDRTLCCRHGPVTKKRSKRASFGGALQSRSLLPRRCSTRGNRVERGEHGSGHQERYGCYCQRELSSRHRSGR